MRKSFKDSLKALEANIHFTNTLCSYFKRLPSISVMLLESLQWSLLDCTLLKPFLLLAKFVQSDHSAYVQDMSAYNFLEIGAATLLVGDMKAKMNGQPWKYFDTANMPYLD
ncbi:hypothetical protein PVK06_006845 [Gossypium arboreum]|uniref:Uncharacterized protein n=1 Tax=Gossypium arboreum TaxID=29729 RepID=A0ABR0QH06_GOSAR|nr:hypothetical protein PVK06_006845 [Gossypium arboreum]